MTVNQDGHPRRGRFVATVVVIVLALSLLIGSYIVLMPKAKGATALEGNLTVSGSAVMLPCIVQEGQGFQNDYPGVTMNITGPGTGIGYSDFLAGKADMVMATSAPTAKQYADAANAGRSFYLNIVGFDSVSVIVHPSNPMSNVTLAQLKGVYFDGSVTDWSSLTGGAKSGPIKIFAVNSSLSGVAGNFIKTVGAGKTAYAANVHYFQTIPLMTAAVANDTDAIGFTSTGLVTASEKAVPVNGVAATPDTVRDASYPISFRLLLISDGVPAGAEKAFVNHVLSNQGQQVMADAGLVPVI